MKKFCFYLPEFILLFLAVVIVTLLTRNINLFMDDFYTIVQIRNYDMHELMQSLWYDSHPPLFFILIKCYSYLVGTSILALKSFNILGYFTLIGAIYYLGFKIGGLYLSRTAAFSLMLLPSLLNNPVLLIRSYLISPLFALLMAGYAYLVYTQPSKKNNILFIVFSICSCFIHYYVTLLTGIIHLILYISLLRQSTNNWKKCLLFSLPCIILFAIWLPVFVFQVHIKMDNIVDSVPFYKRMVGSIVYPFYTDTSLPVKHFSTYITSATLLLLFAYIVVKFLREYKMMNLKRHEIYAIIISIFLPFTIMTIVIIEGYINKPVWFGNYINLYIPIVAFGISLILCKMNNKRFFYIWFSILSLCFSQKLYLQAAMCKDDGFQRYADLYKEGIIKSSDVIINAYNITSVYYPEVQQFYDGELPNNWNRFFYEHIKLVNNYDSILEDKTRFFSGCQLDSVKYGYIFNKGFRLEKRYDFEMKYYDFTSNSLYLYSRE